MDNGTCLQKPLAIDWYIQASRASPLLASMGKSLEEKDERNGKCVVVMFAHLSIVGSGHNLVNDDHSTQLMPCFELDWIKTDPFFNVPDFFVFVYFVITRLRGDKS